MTWFAYGMLDGEPTFSMNEDRVQDQVGPGAVWFPIEGEPPTTPVKIVSTADGLALEPLPNGLTWRDIRIDRDALLNQWQWTVLPGSPLSETCQAAFLNYLKILHRITVDFPAPEAVVWPAVPYLAYAD